MFLGSGINAIIAQVDPDVSKYTLNARRTATTDEQLGRSRCLRL